MKTLVIPDIHNKVDLAEKIVQKYYDVCDKIVYLGDISDDFGDSAIDAAYAAEYIVKITRDPKRILLLSNHDIHYLVSGVYACSGYTPQKAKAIQKVFKDKNWELKIGQNVRLYHWADDILLTHAGLSAGFWEKYSGQKSFDREIFEKMMRDAAAALERREHLPVLNAGYSRGGRQMLGGILWCDWNDEFQAVEGLSQCFGHTPDFSVRQSLGLGSENYCIDTQLRHVAMIENGKVKIIDIDFYKQEL